MTDNPFTPPQSGGYPSPHQPTAPQQPQPVVPAADQQFPTPPQPATVPVPVPPTGQQPAAQPSDDGQGYAGHPYSAPPQQPAAPSPFDGSTPVQHQVVGASPFAPPGYAAPGTGYPGSADQQAAIPVAAYAYEQQGGAGLGVAGAAPIASGATATLERSGKRRGPGWIAVTGIAAGAALVASLGTAALTGSFGDDAGSVTVPSTASIGQNGTSSTQVPVSSSTAENPDWQAVAAAVAASVVAIDVQSSAGESQGSGVIVDSDGHIVTNNHVVSGATNGTVEVTLVDGRILTGTVTGTDPTTDLAVVALDDPPSDLVSAVFADSSEVVVGEPVMAVGNPLGLSNTATTGIVSALNRPVTTYSDDDYSSERVYTNAIQIDAAINPGNSGGPLFNAQGEVIGITSSIATLSSTDSQSGSIGLGFAIPANLAASIGGQLIASGTAQHAFLGVGGLQDGTATVDGATRQGASVGEVVAGSPAATAQLQAGDVIVGIDGNTVSGATSLTAFVRTYAAGDNVTLTLVRDGELLDVTVTLASREDA